MIRRLSVSRVAVGAPRHGVIPLYGTIGRDRLWIGSIGRDSSGRFLVTLHGARGWRREAPAAPSAIGAIRMARAVIATMRGRRVRRMRRMSQESAAFRRG